jgi:hypothetical protein
MDSISSAAFRKTYAKLTAPTTVTVNGHRIGTWMPEGAWTSGSVMTMTAGTGKPLVTDDVRYDTQPVRAVPKTKG